MKRGMIFVVFYDCVSDSPPGCGEEETMMMIMKDYEANADTSRKDKNTDRYAWYLLLSKRRGGSVGW